MTRSELEHAIRAACDVPTTPRYGCSDRSRFSGSSPTHRRCFASQRRRTSCSASARNESTGSMAHSGSYHSFTGGTDSTFTVSPSKSATLPPDWQLRTVTVSGRGARESTGYCVEDTTSQRASWSPFEKRSDAGRDSSAELRALASILIVQDLHARGFASKSMPLAYRADRKASLTERSKSAGSKPLAAVKSRSSEKR
jgi:hypothetical protein